MTGTKPSKGKIIVFGILFWYPLAGVTYQFLHYLIGLRRLGYDPYYLEDSGRWVYDPRINDLSPDAWANIEAVLPALKAPGARGPRKLTVHGVKRVIRNIAWLDDGTLAERLTALSESARQMHVKYKEMEDAGRDDWDNFLEEIAPGTKREFR